MTKQFGEVQFPQFPSLEGQGAIAIDLETNDPELRTRGPGAHRGGYIAGIGIGTEAGFHGYYPIGHENDVDNLPREKVLVWLGEQLQLTRIIHHLLIFCGGYSAMWPIHIANRCLVELLRATAERHNRHDRRYSASL